MKKWLFFLAFGGLCNTVILSNDTIRHQILISVFNNATMLPGSGSLGILNTPLHPGIRVGTVVKFKETLKYDLYSNINLGCYYHHLSQLGFQLYAEPGYRYKFKSGIGLETQLALGYLLAKPDLQVFELNGSGEYQKKSYWRSQLMTGLGIGASYELGSNTGHPMRIFLNYQFFLQTPFVRNYVPLLPNTSLHFGCLFNI